MRKKNGWFYLAVLGWILLPIVWPTLTPEQQSNAVWLLVGYWGTGAIVLIIGILMFLFQYLFRRR